MKEQCFAILITVVFLCVQPICTSQEGTDLGAFIVTAYNIANEADHPCKDATKVLAKGLNNYYCSEFLSDVIMQGSGVDNNNNFIQIDWSSGKKPTTASSTFFTYVPYITTGSGQRLEDGVSIAVDPTVIPLNSWVYIESIGWRRADDTGGAIQGKRIDIFMNVPRDVAMNFGRKSLNVIRQGDSEDTDQHEFEENTFAAVDVLQVGTSQLDPQSNVELYDADYWAQRAYDLQQQNRWEEALQALENSIGLDPDNSEVWRNKGVTLYFLGRYDEAIQATERAIEIDPRNTNAVNQRDQFIQQGTP
jgi:3D (Asp-Asp-Asp) domain-containing protein